MDYKRLYEFRFRDHDQREPRPFGPPSPRTCSSGWVGPRSFSTRLRGGGNLISAVPARERWAIDQVPSVTDLESLGIHTIVSDMFEVELPAAYFDGILLSNTLEHLMNFEDVQRCLRKMHHALRPGGVVAVLGPNFKYCAKEYFDCADHVLALTHVSVQEHLFAAGFQIQSVLPRYLPYSFRGRLPPSKSLTRRYLRNPWAFRLLGKQFLVIASA